MPDRDRILLTACRAGPNPFREGATACMDADLEIVLKRALPETHEGAVAAMEADADRLADALLEFLPAGTMDRMLATLLRAKAASITWGMPRRKGDGQAQAAKDDR